MNYYEILGVPEKASSQEIKKSYKKLVKKYHPDVFEGDKETAEKKIKELNEAYDTLSNPELKQAYDEVLFAPKNDNYNVEYYDSPSVKSDSSYRTDLSPEEKYADINRQNFYSKITTNYYGVSRDDLKKDRDEQIKKMKRESENTGLSSSSRFQLIIALGLGSATLLIIIILLLAYAKDSFDGTMKEIFPESKPVYNEKLPYIYFKMSYKDVVKLLGEPEKTKYVNNKLYAYWGASHIVFDEKNNVAGWYNYGDRFSTDTESGEDFTELENLYNMIEQELNQGF